MRTLALIITSMAVARRACGYIIVNNFIELNVLQDYCSFKQYNFYLTDNGRFYMFNIKEMIALLTTCANMGIKDLIAVNVIEHGMTKNKNCLVAKIYDIVNLICNIFRGLCCYCSGTVGTFPESSMKYILFKPNDLPLHLFI